MSGNPGFVSVLSCCVTLAYRRRTNGRHHSDSYLLVVGCVFLEVLVAWCGVFLGQLMVSVFKVPDFSIDVLDPIPFSGL